MLLLDDILQRIDLLIQLAFNINGAPFFVYAHSVKSAFYRSLYQAPYSWISAARSAARRAKQALRALWARPRLLIVSTWSLAS